MREKTREDRDTHAAIQSDQDKYIVTKDAELQKKLGLTTDGSQLKLGKHKESVSSGLSSVKERGPE